MRKAQTTEFVVYILAIIIFGLTLFYGYKAIKNFSDTTDEIADLQFQNDLTQFIEKVQADSYGTVKKKELNVGQVGEFEEVCVVNTHLSTPNNVNTGNPLIDDRFAAGAKDKNLFLAPPGAKSYFIGAVEVQGAGNAIWVCVPVNNGKAYLRIESMGDHVKISQWG